MMDGLNIDLGDFDLDLGLDNKFESRYLKPKKYKELTEKQMKYEYAQELANDIIITKGSRHFVIVNGSFIFGDLFEALIVKHNWYVKKMTISTLSMSENNIDSLANLIEWNLLDELNIIISDYFFSHERRNLIEYMYEELDKENKFQLAVAGTHCKTVIIETYCGLKIVCHGSANLRSSGNIEQLQIEENETLFDFNDEYQNSIIEKYKTINKAVRSKPLWNAVTKIKEHGYIIKSSRLRSFCRNKTFSRKGKANCS